MPKSDDTNVLLSSLEAIKKDSEAEEASGAAAPRPKPVAPEPAPAPVGLLDSLLDEVKKEADREIQEITRSLEQKTAEVKRQQEDDERRKKEQYDRLIQEEAQRRLALIEKKEDERRRIERDAREKEERRKQAELDAAAQKKRKRSLLVASAATATLAVITAVLVLTGVIPVLDPESQILSDQKPAQPPMVADAAASGKKNGPDGPPIDEPEFLPPGGVVDGPAVAVLAIPEHNDLSRFRVGWAAAPRIMDVAVRTDLMQQKLAKAFAVSSGSGSHGSGSSGGIQIDTSVFKD
jgi:hypothetical protein